MSQSTETTTVRSHIHISGRVQGVGFRWSTQRRAQEAGVGGWVRNLWDGRVEAVFEGPEEAVEQMVRWAHQGPRSARVEKVETKREEPTGEFSSFNIKH